MSAAKILLFLFLAFVLVVVLSGGCVYRGYNRAIALDESVENRWAQVENQLQRRFDLIDNLVETVKGVAAQEQEVFLGIARSREKYFQADSVPEKAAATGEFESALSRLLLLREAYPELRSNESFLKLQDQLEGTENRLAVERQRYNEAVRELNVFRRQFPSSFYANLAGIEPGEYPEIAEAARERPDVDFSGIRAAPAAEAGAKPENATEPDAAPAAEP